MYNHYENNNKDNTVNPQNTNNQNPQSNYPYPPSYPNYQNNNYQTQPWQAKPVQAPVYSPKPPKKEKEPKEKKGIGALKLTLIILLTVLISSGSSVALFSGLVNSGFITINSTQSQDNGSLAFTINKVVDNDEENIGEVSSLTNQQIAQKVVPSVVCIQNYQIAESYNIFGQIIGNTENSELTPASEGSGIIMSDDGYIITNAHVVEDATDLKVILYDGKTVEATLVGADSITDLAVIKIDPTDDMNLTVAEFGSSSDLVVGDGVMAIGNPGGLTLSSTVTTGIVSAINREITVEGYTMSLVQTDAAISPGNSGGALVNEYGQVVGINSLKFKNDGYEGLGFAIPIDNAQSIISNLIDYGYVKNRAVIGIAGTFVDPTTARFYGLSVGMYVAELTSDNAKKAGLEVGDVITSINGEKITSFSDISNKLLNLKAGDTVMLKVDRVLTEETDLEIELVLSEYVVAEE